MAQPDHSPKAPFAGPAGNDPDALLGRIMGDLDLPQPSAQQYRRYHKAARLRFLAPRALAVGAFLLLLALLCWCLACPASISDVQAQAIGGGTAQQVSFRVRGPVVRDVSARLGPALLPLRHQGGTYSVEVPRNGTLTLGVETPLGQHVTQAVAIDGVDEEAPHLAGDERIGDDVVIHLTDGDGVGIDWAGITGTLASGQAYPCLAVDEAAGTVRYRLPEETLYIAVPDRNGNTLHATLTPDNGLG